MEGKGQLDMGCVTLKVWERLLAFNTILSHSFFIIYMIYMTEALFWCRLHHSCCCCPGENPQRRHSLCGQAASQGPPPQGEGHADPRGTRLHDHRWRFPCQWDETGMRVRHQSRLSCMSSVLSCSQVQQYIAGTGPKTHPSLFSKLHFFPQIHPIVQSTSVGVIFTNTDQSEVVKMICTLRWCRVNYWINMPFWGWGWEGGGCLLKSDYFGGTRLLPSLQTWHRSVKLNKNKENHSGRCITSHLYLYSTFTTTTAVTNT